MAAVILYFNLIYVRKVTKAFWNVIALMCFCAPILLPKKDGGNTFIYYYILYIAFPLILFLYESWQIQKISLNLQRNTE